MDIFFAKYDASGNFSYARSMGGSGSDLAWGLAADAAGNVYLAGSYSNSMDFNPGAGTAFRAAQNASDIFITRFDGLAPLPVEWLSFTAEAVDQKHVACSWTTATETNNDHFTVLRSHDGVHFDVIGTVSGSGNSKQTKSYSFTDAEPFLGTSYYRIQQTDFNGNKTASKIIPVQVKVERPELHIFPNPSNGRFTIQTGQQDEGDIKLKLTDMTGKTIWQEVVTGSYGLYSIRLTDYIAGIYQLECIQKDASHSCKISLFP